MSSYKDLPMMNQSISWDEYDAIYTGRDENGMTKISPP
jgi:hypothetical protein